MIIPNDIKSQNLNHIVEEHEFALHEASDPQLRAEHREASAHLAAAFGRAFLELHRMYEEPTVLSGGAYIPSEPAAQVNLTAADIVTLAKIVVDMDLPPDQIMHIVNFRRENRLYMIKAASEPSEALFKAKDAYYQLQTKSESLF